MHRNLTRHTLGVARMPLLNLHTSLHTGAFPLVLESRDTQMPSRSCLDQCRKQALLVKTTSPRMKARSCMDFVRATASDLHCGHARVCMHAGNVL